MKFLLKEQTALKVILKHDWVFLEVVLEHDSFKLHQNMAGFVYTLRLYIVSS